MQLGNWRNFDELEDSLSYPELVAMVDSMRETEHRRQKFQAALKGIDIDKDKSQQEDPVEQAKRRVRAKMAGVDEETLRFRENTAAAGFQVITE